jgi:hypothetical protein
MLATSVRYSCAVETVAITDTATQLRVPAFQFHTTETRLMLWMLDVSLRYLESPRFDRDTVLVSPDMLVYGDLSRYFVGDLGVLVRSAAKYADKPLLNGMQWWRYRAKHALVAFYEQALLIARTLPESLLRWGADTEPLRLLLTPLEEGLQFRCGLRVAMLPTGEIMESLTRNMMTDLYQHGETWPHVPVVDFKDIRKLSMRQYFNGTVGRKV